MLIYVSIWTRNHLPMTNISVCYFWIEIRLPWFWYWSTEAYKSEELSPLGSQFTVSLCKCSEPSKGISGRLLLGLLVFLK